MNKVCEQCGLVHKDGLNWHGACYNCGGKLIEWKEEDYKLTAVTPKGIQIYEKIKK